MLTSCKQKVIELAEANKDEEICGFFIYRMDSSYEGGAMGVLEVFACENISQDKKNHFEISPEDYLRAQSVGTICGLYHSHPGNEESFSGDDIDSIEEVGVPLYLYTVETKRWQEYVPPTYLFDKKYTNIPFVWGVHDCYGMLRIYYREEMGLFLKDYDRDDLFGCGSSGKLLVFNNIQNEGFEIISSRPNLDVLKMRQNDALIFDTRGCHETRNDNEPIHFGIYVGNNRFLHHPLGRPSLTQTLDNQWIKRIICICRYEG